MRTYLFRGVFALAAILLACGPALAQGGLIKGKVLDPQGEPVDKAKVEIVSEDGRTYETTTDRKGEFVQIGLRSGSYDVTASKEKIGAEKRRASVRQGGSGTNMEFNLSPVSGLTAADQKKLVELQAAFNAGIEATRAGSHDVAVHKFAEATTISPDCGDCYINLGHAHVQKDEYDQAEAAYRRATELDANSAEAYSGLALVYNAQQKFDLAKEAGAKASALMPTGGGGGGAEAHYNHGVILWNSGEFKEAKAEFEAAVAADAAMADAHYQLAMANLNLGLIPDAVKAFEGYLAAAPDGPKAAEVKAAIGALKQ